MYFSNSSPEDPNLNTWGLVVVGLPGRDHEFEHAICTKVFVYPGLIPLLVYPGVTASCSGPLSSVFLFFFLLSLKACSMTWCQNRPCDHGYSGHSFHHTLAQEMTDTATCVNAAVSFMNCTGSHCGCLFPKMTPDIGK